MAYNQLRMNVRNLLVGANLTEARQFVVDAVERGENETAKYADEFVRELEEEEFGVDGCDVDPMFDGEYELPTY